MQEHHGPDIQLADRLSNLVPMWSEKDDDQNIESESHSDSEPPFVVGRKVVVDCFATTKVSRRRIPR